MTGIKTLLTVITLFLFIPVLVYGQSEVQYQDCTAEVQKSAYSPAPCSITGQGIVTDLFLIQVGAYRAMITPKSGTIMIPTSTVDPQTNHEGIMYRYYVAAIFPTRQEAEDFLITQKIKEDFCDAIVVPFPFLGMKGFR